MSVWLHTLWSHWARSCYYPGKSACLARRRTGHHSGMPYHMLQPCGTSSVSELEMSSKDNISSSSEPFSSPSTSAGSSSFFPKKMMSEELEQYHSRPPESLPRGTLCQTARPSLTQLGLSCQNLTHWNRKNVALISSLESDMVSRWRVVGRV